MTEKSTESTPTEQPAEEEKEETRTSGDVGFIESVFLLGLGAASATKSAVESLTKDLVERGKITQQDAAKFAQDLAKRADESTKSFQKTASEGASKAASLTGMATKADVARIEADLDEIRETLRHIHPAPDTGEYVP